MNGYSRILKAARSQPWAIMPDKLEAILGFLELKASGGSATVSDIAEIHASAEIAAARASNVSAASTGSVAVIPVYGCIMPRANLMDDISGGGGCSIEMLTKQLRAAINDPNVRAIVLDIASPGGSVEGVPELGAEILAARANKKITAVSDYLCASAAYWLASCCSDVVVSPSSLTGSVGVYSSHEDDSVYLEKAGVKVTLISYGENKTQGNPYEPLSDAGRSNMQEMVDEYGAMFDKAVAKGRKMSADKVHGTFGQGLCFTAEQAVKIGMADSVGTLDDVLARYGVSRSGSASQANAQNNRAEVPESGVQASVQTDLEDGEPTCRNSDGDPCDPDDPDCDQEQSDEGCSCTFGSASAKQRADINRRIAIAAA